MVTSGQVTHYSIFHSHEPGLKANVNGLSSVELDLLSMKVLHCRNAEFCDFICSCDLEHDLMTFIYKLDRYPWNVNWSANEAGRFFGIRCRREV